MATRVLQRLPYLQRMFYTFSKDFQVDLDTLAVKFFAFIDRHLEINKFRYKRRYEPKTREVSHRMKTKSNSIQETQKFQGQQTGPALRYIFGLIIDVLIQAMQKG